MYHRQVTCKVRINITNFGKFEGLTSFHSYINRSSTAIKRSYYEDESADACKIGCSDDSRVELAGNNVSDREHAVTIRSSLAHWLDRFWTSWCSKTCQFLRIRTPVAQRWLVASAAAGEGLESISAEVHDLGKRARDDKLDSLREDRTQLRIHNSRDSRVEMR